MAYRNLPIGTSTNLAQADYEDNEQTLRITFWRDNRMYEYYGVPVKVADGLAAAFSPGAYFRQFIKDVYDCVEV